MSDSGNDSGANQVGSDSITVNVFGRTDVGLVREHNEDNFLVADLASGNRSIKPEVRTHRVGEKGSLFVVCDGMGGAAAGEVASRIGVDTIYEMMQEADTAEDDEDLARQLDAAITEAGVRIFTAAKVNRKQRGMGTTVTAAVLKGPRLIIGQVGDSRAYILRAGELSQVTKDQSLVQQLIDAKQLTKEEARFFDRSNIILQALGTTEEVHVDMTSVVLRRNDTLVMCSDGLSGVVESDVIRDVVMQLDDPLEMCKRLTDLACEGGGHDNITVIVARFDGDGLLDPRDGEDIVYEKFQYTPSARDEGRKSGFRDDSEPSVVEEIGRTLDEETRGGRIIGRRKNNIPLLVMGALAGLIAGGAVVAFNVLLGGGEDALVAPPGTAMEVTGFAAETDSDLFVDERDLETDSGWKAVEEGSEAGHAADTPVPAKDTGSADAGGVPEETDDERLAVETDSEATVDGQPDDTLKADDIESTDGFESPGAFAPGTKQPGAQPKDGAKPKNSKKTSDKKRVETKQRLNKKQDKWRPPAEEAPRKLDDNPF